MPNSNDRIYRYQPLFGSWTVEEEIGEGSFGIVYLVSKEQLGEKYTSAVKLISIPSKEQYREAVTSVGDDEKTLHVYFQDIVANIIKEVNILHSLSGNINVLNYHDHSVYEREDKIGWDILIRMEYVTPLSKYLKNNNMSREQIIQLGINLCSALELCTKKGILHRDIKDENIFINEDGIFKLGDFGIAKELSKTGRTASMKGTPLFMAPEVYRGEKYDVTVDIYSLGIVLYKLLNNGRMPLMPPYPETIKYTDSEEALLKRMSGEQLPIPASAGRELGRIVVKACAFKSTDRYASASEMKKDLESILSKMDEKVRQENVAPYITASPKTKKQVLDTEKNETKEELANIESDNLKTEDSNKTVGVFSNSNRSSSDSSNRTLSVFSIQQESEISERLVKSVNANTTTNSKELQEPLSNRLKNLIIVSVCLILVISTVAIFANGRRNNTDLVASTESISKQPVDLAADKAAADKAAADKAAMDMAVADKAAVDKAAADKAAADKAAADKAAVDKAAADKAAADKAAADKAAADKAAADKAVADKAAAFKVAAEKDEAAKIAAAKAVATNKGSDKVGPIIYLNNVYEVNESPATLQFNVTDESYYTEVWVDYQRAWVSANGMAVIAVKNLHYGVNEFDVIAYDLYGNASEAILVVEYLKPATVVLTIGSTYVAKDGVAVFDLEQAPTIVNGRIFLPARFVSENLLGGTIVWDGATKSLTLDAKDLKIKMLVGAKFAYINGNFVSLLVAPYIEVVTGRIIVPINEIMEAVGITISYNAIEQTVTLTIPAEVEDIAVFKVAASNIVADKVGPVIYLDSVYQVAKSSATISFVVTDESNYAEVWSGYQRVWVSANGSAVFEVNDLVIGVNEFDVIAYDLYGNASEAILVVEYLK